jgi:hypothetical protein
VHVPFLNPFRFTVLPLTLATPMLSTFAPVAMLKFGPCLSTGMLTSAYRFSLVNRHDGLVGVVFLVCLARVIFAGGADRPCDVFAIPAFADDDENVVHPTVVDPGTSSSRPRRRRSRSLGGVQRNYRRDLVVAITNMGLRHKGSPAWFPRMYLQQ